VLVAGVNNQVGHVAGLMALAFGKVRSREAQRAQLMAAIASEFQANEAVEPGLSTAQRTTAKPRLMRGFCCVAATQR